MCPFAVGPCRSDSNAKYTDCVCFRELMRLKEERMALSKGGRVNRNTSRGRTQGKVVSKHTEEFTFEDQKFNASKDEPYYVTESEKTGSLAVHKQSALKELKNH